jgi:hypothetical protein
MTYDTLELPVKASLIQLLRYNNIDQTEAYGRGVRGPTCPERRSNRFC